MLWEETLAAGGYAGKELGRGARLRLVDLQGDACVSMLVFNAESPVERLNVADTIKVQWNAYLGAGAMLLSDMGAGDVSLTEDDAADHDTFCGPSNTASNARRYDDGFNHGRRTPTPATASLLAPAKFGLGRKDVHPCINWFKAVSIAPDGTTVMNVGPFRPGTQPDPAGGDGRRSSSWPTVPTSSILAPTTASPPCEPRLARSGHGGGRSDPQRTPERLRAFQNVEDYYLR